MHRLFTPLVTKHPLTVNGRQETLEWPEGDSRPDRSGAARATVDAGGQGDSASAGEAKGAGAGALHRHHWPAPQDLPLHPGQVRGPPLAYMSCLHAVKQSRWSSQYVISQAALLPAMSADSTPCALQIVGA